MLRDQSQNAGKFEGRISTWIEWEGKQTDCRAEGKSREKEFEGEWKERGEKGRKESRGWEDTEDSSEDFRACPLTQVLNQSLHAQLGFGIIHKTKFVSDF